MLFTFQNKRRNTGSCTIHQVRDLPRKVFCLLQFHALFLFVVISASLMEGL